jgi:hypothetical protein
VGEISVKTGNNARNGGKNSLNRLIRCVCGKKSAQIREILISESAWEEMTCLFAPSLIKGCGEKMALKGTMLLNGADYAPFNLYGVGVFMAHSGQGIYRNNGFCGAVKGSGPIPGKYWIVDRGTGGFFSGLKAKVQDRWNKVRSGAEFGRNEWFALYKDDWGIDDGTWIDNVYRGLFRLHPGTVSEGCITIAHNSDYALIRNALMSTELIQVPCMRSLMARGWVEVSESGYTNACP